LSEGLFMKAGWKHRSRAHCTFPSDPVQTQSSFVPEPPRHGYLYLCPLWAARQLLWEPAKAREFPPDDAIRFWVLAPRAVRPVVGSGRPAPSARASSSLAEFLGANPTSGEFASTLPHPSSAPGAPFPCENCCGQLSVSGGMPF